MKTKYMKLFVLTQPPKDDLFEVFPFILGKAIFLTVERHLKNGKLILNSPDVELEMFQIVHSELNGFTVSHSYLKKNLRKYLNPKSFPGLLSQPREGLKNALNKEDLHKIIATNNSHLKTSRN